MKYAVLYKKNHLYTTSQPQKVLLKRVIVSPLERVRNIASSVSVCLSFCSHISKPYIPTSRNFLWTLPMTVARSSSRGVAICYVLPVLYIIIILFAQWYNSTCININTIEKSRTARSDKNTNSCPTTCSKTLTGYIKNYIFSHTSEVLQTWRHVNT